MPSPTWSQTIDSFFTATWSYRRGPAVIQAFEKNPFYFWLKEKGKVRGISGYRRIEIPIEYGSNETIRWVGRGDTVPMSEQDLLNMTYENWKYVAVTIMRYGTEDHQNKGQARMINYAETKTNAAERALHEEFERVVNGDGSGAKEPNGLQNIISNTPTTGTVHGINRATAGYSYWRNQQKTATGTASIYLLSDMRTMLNNCTKYAQTEIDDVIIMCDQSSYEVYEDETLEFMSIVNKTLGDASFQTINYKGRPLIWSPSAVANQMRFVNTNYFELVYDEGYFMEMTDWKAIPDQVNDKVAQIVCAMQFITTRPVTHGCLTVSP